MTAASSSKATSLYTVGLPSPWVVVPVTLGYMGIPDAFGLGVPAAGPPGHKKLELLGLVPGPAATPSPNLYTVFFIQLSCTCVLRQGKLNTS